MSKYKIAEAYPPGTHVKLIDPFGLFDDVDPDATHLVIAKPSMRSNMIGCRGIVAIIAGALRETPEKVTCILCLAKGE